MKYTKEKKPFEKMKKNYLKGEGPEHNFYLVDTAVELWKRTDNKIISEKTIETFNCSKCPAVKTVQTMIKFNIDK